MRFTKLTLLLASLTLVLLFAFTAGAADVYDDVPADHWAYDAVKRLADAGILSDFADGEFKGDALLTRYEMAMYTNRAINYLIGNVDRMNRTQAALISRTLEDLVAEFNRDMTHLALDVRQLRMELEQVQSGLKPWDFDIAHTVDASFIEANGPAVDDPFADTPEAVVSKNVIENHLAVTLSGEMSGYLVDLDLAGTSAWDLAEDRFPESIDTFKLTGVTDGHYVAAGTLTDLHYNEFLLSEEDLVLFGIETVSDNVKLADSVSLTYGTYRHGAGNNGVLAAGLTRKVADWNVDLFAGMHLDRSLPIFEGDRVFGAGVHYHKSDLSIDGFIARDGNENTATGVEFGYYGIDKLEMVLGYKDVPAGFSGVLADFDSGKTFTANGKIDLTDHLSVYYEGSKDLAVQSDVATEIGARVDGYPILPGFAVDLRGYTKSNKDTGYEGTVSFDVKDLASVAVSYGAENGDTTFRASLSGERHFGPMSLSALAEYASKDEGAFSKYGLAFSHDLAHATALGINYRVSKFAHANDDTQDFDTREIYISLTTSF